MAIFVGIFNRKKHNHLAEERRKRFSKSKSRVAIFVGKKIGAKITNLVDERTSFL